MIPYYEADTLFRIMENRLDRVREAQHFYLEYLKLMNHYGLLDEAQKAQFKTLKDKTKVATHQVRMDPAAEREAKIAAMKQKKHLEQTIEVKTHSSSLLEVEGLQGR